MNSPFVWLWTLLIFASILWYVFLLFWLGIKGGYEIRRMIRTLSQQAAASEQKAVGEESRCETH